MTFVILNLFPCCRSPNLQCRIQCTTGCLVSTSPSSSLSLLYVPHFETSSSSPQKSLILVESYLKNRGESIFSNKKIKTYEFSSGRPRYYNFHFKLELTWETSSMILKTIHIVLIVTFISVSFTRIQLPKFSFRSKTGLKNKFNNRERLSNDTYIVILKIPESRSLLVHTAIHQNRILWPWPLLDVPIRWFGLMNVKKKLW